MCSCRAMIQFRSQGFGEIAHDVSATVDGYELLQLEREGEEGELPVCECSRGAGSSGWDG